MSWPKQQPVGSRGAFRSHQRGDSLLDNRREIMEVFLELLDLLGEETHVLRNEVGTRQHSFIDSRREQVKEAVRNVVALKLEGAEHLNAVLAQEAVSAEPCD